MTSCLLQDRACVPCRGGVPSLHGAALQELSEQLGTDWDVVDDHHLTKTIRFKNFRQALHFTNAVGELAEAEGHHPEITLAWGRVTLRVWTHSANGLTESDFILAAKIDHIDGQ